MTHSYISKPNITEKIMRWFLTGNFYFYINKFIFLVSQHVQEDEMDTRTIMELSGRRLHGRSSDYWKVYNVVRKLEMTMTPGQAGHFINDAAAQFVLTIQRRDQERLEQAVGRRHLRAFRADAHRNGKFQF